MHHRRSALRLGFCGKENGKDRRLARETRSAAAEVEKSHRLPSAFPLLRPCIMQRAEVGGGSGRILKIPFSIPSPFPPFPPSPSLFFLSYRLRWWRGGGKRGEGGLATIGKRGGGRRKELFLFFVPSAAAFPRTRTILQKKSRAGGKVPPTRIRIGSGKWKIGRRGQTKNTRAAGKKKARIATEKERLE